MQSQQRWQSHCIIQQPPFVAIVLVVCKEKSTPALDLMTTKHYTHLSDGEERIFYSAKYDLRQHEALFANCCLFRYILCFAKFADSVVAVLIHIICRLNNCKIFIGQKINYHKNPNFTVSWPWHKMTSYPHFTNHIISTWESPSQVKSLSFWLDKSRLIQKEGKSASDHWVSLTKH